MNDSQIKKFISLSIEGRRNLVLGSSSGYATDEIDTIKDGSGSYNDVVNMSGYKIFDNQDIIMMRTNGDNFLLGFSPFASSKSIKEIT